MSSSLFSGNATAVHRTPFSIVHTGSNCLTNPFSRPSLAALRIRGPPRSASRSSCSSAPSTAGTIPRLVQTVVSRVKSCSSSSARKPDFWPAAPWPARPPPFPKPEFWLTPSTGQQGPLQQLREHVEQGEEHLDDLLRVRRPPREAALREAGLLHHQQVVADELDRVLGPARRHRLAVEEHVHDGPVERGRPPLLQALDLLAHALVRRVILAQLEERDKRQLVLGRVLAAQSLSSSLVARAGGKGHATR